MSVITELTPEEKLKNKSIAQAKSAIESFLRELNINKILYVDDKCSINDLKEIFIGSLLTLKGESPEKELFGSWSGSNTVFKSRVTKLWDDANEPEKRELYIKLLEFKGNKEDIENSMAPLKLKEHLGDKIDLFSPTEWVNQKDAILAQLNEDSKVLCLFDIDFGTAPPPDGRNGKTLAVEVLSLEAISNFVYCGIFSHLFNVSQEFEQRNEISKSHNLDKDKFYTISKKRFTSSDYLPALAEGIKNTLLISEIEYLKKESTTIIKSSFNKSLEELKELTPDTFNHVIQKSSKKEGSWEMTNLLRINSIINTDKSLNNLLSKNKREKINKSLSKIRRVEKVKTGADTPYDKEQIVSLRKREIYIDAKILNELHFPISNGDIFKIENKNYILLGQPCNLALRSSGKRDIRGGQIFSTAFLLELEVVENEALSKVSKSQLLTMGFIEKTELPNDKSEIVRFPLFKTISLAPLDLTVFNSSGIACINLNQEKSSLQTLQDSWKVRYIQLHKQFSGYRNNIRVFKNLKSKDKEILKDSIYYGDLFKGFKINNEGSLNSKSTKLTLNIERTGHYKSPYSADLLQQFMDYLSRNAFERNFLND